MIQCLFSFGSKMTSFEKAYMNYSQRLIVPSPLGDIVVQGTQTHIQYLKFAYSEGEKLVESIYSMDLSAECSTNCSADWSEQCRLQLQRYFLSQPSQASQASQASKSFEFDLPIDPQGTEFQQRVWQALGDIKHGAFASYQQLATAIGNINPVRAVASANARNPIWLIIPCHRVIGSDNALRGYAGGIERKGKLLQLEHHQLELTGDALINKKTKIVC